MKTRVWIIDDEAMSKPADEVLKTAGREGGWEEVYRTPFFSAFTKKERRDYLRDFVFHVNDAWGKKVIKLKDCQLVKGEITDMDSTNMSHAGAYYRVWIEVPRRAVAGTSMAEIMVEIP